MSENNIFEQASREKLRFPSIKGDLVIEQLWDLPLQSSRSNTVDLDSVARTVNADLKAVTEESFVQTRTNPVKAQLTLKLDILKHIIATKQTENAQKTQAAANESEILRLKGLLAEKNDEALKGLSPQELEARIKQLGG